MHAKRCGPYRQRSIPALLLNLVRNVLNFLKPHISDGAVAWSGNEDLAPDGIYMAIKARDEWALR